MVRHLVVKSVNFVKLIKISLWLAVFTLIAIFFLDFTINKFFNFYVESLISYIYNSLDDKSAIYVLLTSETAIFTFVTFVFGVIIYCKSEINKIHLITFGSYLFLWLLIILRIKTELKYLFSRCVPIMCYKPVTQNAIDKYGFSWFNLNEGFASFPSGHCILASFCLVWASILVPRLQNFFLISYVIGVTILVVLNYHFISDCLAGTLVGIMCCICSAWLWNYTSKYFLRCEKIQ